MVNTTTTTRPRFAQLLMNAGIEIKALKSIWDPTKVMWEFVLDERSAELAKQFYEEEGKPL